MNDLIFVNGKVCTMQQKGHRCDALAVRGDKILAVGDEAEVRALLAPNPEVIDLAGAFLVPGLHDSHVHLTRHGFELDQLKLDTVKTLDEALALVKARAETLAEGDWLLGSGFAAPRWGLHTVTRQQLDQIAPHHPVALESQDHHSAWVNTTALERLNIGPSTPDPEHGVIVRETDGYPSGLLLEQAMYLVREGIETPNDAAIANALDRAAADLARYGVTTVHHMAAEPAVYWRQQGLRAARPDYGLRVWSCIPQEDAEHALALGLATGQGGARFQVGGAKFFADGALGSRTAWMLEPYESEENQGMPVHNLDLLRERLPLVIEAGLTPVIHAIGDAANRAALDALEETADLWRAQHLRPRLEHAQHLHPEDLPRFAQLGVVASVQPIHMVFDAPTMPKLLGARTDRAYRFRSLVESGATLALGSDTPVASPDTLGAIRAAVKRHDADGQPFHPKEALGVYETLCGYTRNAAYAIGWEGRSGQLRAEFDADITILSHDPFETLEDSSNKATMLAGRWTWRG